MSRIVAIVAVTLVNCSLRKHLIIIVDVLSCCIRRIAQHRLPLFSSFTISISTISSINFIDFSCSTTFLHYASSHEQILRIVRCLVANIVTLRHITNIFIGILFIH